MFHYRHSCASFALTKTYWLTKQKSVEAGSKTGKLLRLEKSVESLCKIERVVISGMGSCGEPQAPAEVELEGRWMESNN